MHHESEVSIETPKEIENGYALAAEEAFKEEMRRKAEAGGYPAIDDKDKIDEIRRVDAWRKKMEGIETVH